MRTIYKELESVLLSVTLLTFLCGCSSLLPKFVDMDDPVARVAEQERRFYNHELAPPAIDASAQRKLIQRAIASNEVELGMRMEDVQAVWGQPQQIETAGGHHSENQKWIYFRSLQSFRDLRPSKIVYFEEGRVAGWDHGDDLDVR